MARRERRRRGAATGLFLVACVIFGGGDLAARLGLIRGEDDGGFAGGFGRGVRQRAGRGLGRRRGGDFVVDGQRGVAVGCEVQRDVLHRVELRRARVERFVRPLSDVVVGFPRGRFAREIRLPVGDGVGEDPHAALLLAVLAAMLISMLRGALRRRRRGGRDIGSRGHGCGDRRLASSERWREISAVSQKNARGSEETKKSRQRRGGERAGGKLGCRSRSIPGCHVGTTAIETRVAAHSLRRRLTGSTSIGLSSSRCPRRSHPRSPRASTSCRRPSAPAPRQVPTASPDHQNR